MSHTQEINAAETHGLYQRVGELTRRLHESLRELGYDKRIEETLGTVPDAKARLSFIATVTGNAAEKVLNTVDAAQAQQEALANRASEIEALLQRDGGNAGPEVARFIAEVKAGAQATQSQLTDIMLAQDFHDLTGQTVRKVVDVAASMEEALVQLLIEASPITAPRVALDGPVADPTRTDVVANQAQVDDLLESLGF